MANHSSILAWKIPWTEEPGGLQSMGSWRVGHDLETEHQGLQRIFWAIPCELSYRYWSPHHVKEVTYMMTDCSHDISCHNSKNWPQRNGNKSTLELKINCYQDDTGQTTDDQFQEDYQNWLCCFCLEPPPSAYRKKALVPWLSVQGWGWRWERTGLWTGSLPNPSPLPASKIKQLFLFPPTWPLHWLLSSEQSDPTFSYTQSLTHQS